VNIVPSKAQPTAITANTGSNSAREAAIKAFNDSAAQQVAQPAAAPQTQEFPVQNPNKVSPEEVTAIQAQSKPEVAEKSAEPENPGKSPESETQKTERDPALSRQFAQLARQEKILRQKAQQQEREIKAREEALKTKEAAILTQEQKYQQGYISKDQLKQDTLRILAESGVSYDELTQQILNQQAPDPRTEATIKRLEAKIQELEGKTTKVEKTYEDQQKQAYQTALKQIRTDVQNTVNSDPSFEAIKATRSVQDVVDLIEQTYNKDGVLLSVEEACQEVENYLVDEALKLTRIQKIKGKLTQTAQPAKTTDKPAQQTQMKTLTNAVSSTRKLSAKERAILAFNGQLKT
jgi:hypothetical protein